ncbi:MAG: hypothetical protein AAGI91_06085 [Bacteroidota bacterium]
MPISSRTDLIVSGAAIFISLCTLVVLLYEARITREQQRAAVWPYVEIGLGFGNGGFVVRTANQGVGPARIRAMEVRVGGEPVRTWQEMLAALGFTSTDFTADRTNGRVLPGQSSIASFGAQVAEPTGPFQEAYLQGERLVFEVCYCSVYDDCWRVQARGLEETREEVTACTPDSDADFQR